LSRNFAPTVIHAHIFAPAGFASVICGALFGVPVVITEHYTGFLRKSLSSSGRLIARWAMSRADGVISVSEDLKNHIEAYGVRNRFWIIPNPVDVRNFRVGETVVNGGPPRIVSVTNFRSMAKNVPLLIEAFAEVVGSSDLNPQLHIVGDGPMRPQIEALINQKGIGSQVVLHGFLSRTELADVLADSDLFVLASLWENCPVALLEARLAGLPMVVTAVGGVPEIIDPETGILVESGNVDALVNGIVEGLSAAPSADSASIRERAMSQISREAVGKRLIGVYESVS
jgi:glycosyltransferase involved in cell wall biosynthesis